ncbi:RILP-like protein 1 [Corythoichthys intestinalis]|uniref:RILP-like protein 1 n=1 Tax=Corythoichthys intestinalis TaxID=161448 RepID=UPI0025A5BBAE|nr:RILP-like protein 1 [Corythoichthys intestinalis]XP_061804497.1 RILP-like protein 1 [Nerophis lumbriciformis]
MSATSLEKPWSELTVSDVYDIAAVLAHEFQRTIERFGGGEALVGLAPKVVRVLELLESLVTERREKDDADGEELREELLRLRRERSDRMERETKHRQESEQVEDAWRAEVDRLHSRVAQLRAENEKLLAAGPGTPLGPLSSADPDLLEEGRGPSEKEERLTSELKRLLERQREEIHAKDQQLTQKNQDVEALQRQQKRLIRINQDLRQRLCAAAEVEAALRRESGRLGRELRELELERLLARTEARNETSISPQVRECVEANSVWAECGGDPYCLPGAAGPDTRFAMDTPEDEEEAESVAPHFSVQELGDVLEERNQLKAQVFLLQEELAYYQSEDSSEDDCRLPLGTSTSAPPPRDVSSDLPESGIGRLIFTAIMPMVAAGLIADDPTLLPISRLVSLV